MTGHELLQGQQYRLVIRHPCKHQAVHTSMPIVWAIYYGFLRYKRSDQVASHSGL